MRATRWGICGAGKISHDFATAIETLPREEHELVAIASRKLSRAKNFADTHKIPKFYSAYISVARDESVDVVFIGTITTSHSRLCKIMMNEGKHVLCAKPLTMNMKKSLELVQLSITTKVFFMENVWSRCSPVYGVLLEDIEKGTIGEVKHVIVGFGKKRNFADRTLKKSMGGGATLDLGGDAIQFVLMIFDHERPISCRGRAILDENELDMAMSATMVFKGDRHATLFVHDPVGVSDVAHVIGTKGKIVVPHFWCPTVIHLPDETKVFKLPEPKHKLNYRNSTGMSYSAAEARECILRGASESTKITNVDSLAIAELQDLVRKQIGVYYDVDKI